MAFDPCCQSEPRHGSRTGEEEKGEVKIRDGHGDERRQRMMMFSVARLMTTAGKKEHWPGIKGGFALLDWHNCKMNC